MRIDPNLNRLRLDLDLALRRRASLFTAKNGGSIRTLIDGSAVHPTGVYRSAKAKRPQPWKSLEELARIQICEVDGSVASYLAQPHRIDFHLPGEDVSFFADLRIDRVDGSVEIELSPPSKSVSKGDVVGWAREIYAALNWKFRQRSSGEHRNHETLLENARRIEGDRFTVVPPQAILATRSVVQSANGEVSYRDLTEHIGTLLDNRPRGRAVVHAMIVQGQLAVDLDRPLRPGTQLRLRQLNNGR